MQLKELRKKFVKDKISDIDIIKRVYESLKRVNEDILEYVQKNRNQEWVVSSEISNWFEELNYNDKEKYRGTIDKLKETGFYSASNFYLIREKNHISFLKQKFADLTYDNDDYKCIYEDGELIIDYCNRYIYILEFTKAFEIYNEQLFNGMKIIIDNKFKKLLRLKKSNNNIKSFSQNVTDGKSIESFSIKYDFILIEDPNNKDNLIKLLLDDFIKSYTCESSVHYFLQSVKDKPTFVTKLNLNKDKNDLERYKSRIICNKLKGINYN